MNPRHNTARWLEMPTTSTLPPDEANPIEHYPAETNHVREMVWFCICAFVFFEGLYLAPRIYHYFTGG